MDERALDRSIQILREHGDAWARLPVAQKADYIQGILDGYVGGASRLVVAANRAKGIPENETIAGEEWAHPYLTVRFLRLLRDTLRDIAVSGGPRLPEDAVRIRSNGRLAVRVFPLSVPDRLLYGGFTGEIWMPSGVTVENLADHMATFYRRKEPGGKVALVLGAGNVASIGPLDMAHKLFAEGQVCLFKHNPVNEYLAPLLDEAFGALIRDGFVRTVRGGPDVGAYLCGHPGIDEIHLTGSDRTYEAIVFGPGEEGRRRKLASEPRITKRFTCELGNVSPVIVVPGEWSRADLRFHAENIATQMINNCGFNCIASKVLILHEGWPQARILMDELRAVLGSQPARKAYYPGAEADYDRIVAACSRVEAIGSRAPGVVPFTLVPGVDSTDSRHACFTREWFMPLMAQTSLPGAGAGEFLRNAVRFCNETLWGTLAACVLIHPNIESALGGALDEAIEDLRYGTVAVNHWSALSYVLGSPGWGGSPGRTPSDIQSGIGMVHNSFLLDEPEKNVLRGPFRVWPKPPWFVTNRRTDRIFPKMIPLEARPGLRKTLSVAMTAIRG